MADYSGAIDYFVDPSRTFIGQNSCETIVVHGTGGDANQSVQQLGEYFRLNSLRTSVHFGIDRAGIIAQYVRLSDGAGGNCCTENGYDAFWQPFLNKYGNLNLCSISIEHVNDSANSLPLTDAQKQASFKLIAFLCQKYHIAPDHIKSHASIAPQSRAHCPGNYPWAELFAFLQGGSMGIPQNWHDDGHTLTAPNNIPVALGFREWILDHDWDAGNIPQAAEFHSPYVLLHNKSIGAGQIQIFRDGMLWYTPDRGVVQEPYNGLEIAAAYAEIAQLQATRQTGPLAPHLDAALSTLHALLTATDAFKVGLQNVQDTLQNIGKD